MAKLSYGIRFVVLAAAVLALAGAPCRGAQGALVGAWSTLAPDNTSSLPPMPTPRFNVATVVVGGNLVVLGGQTSFGAPSASNIVGTVEMYRSQAAAGSGGKNVWIALPPMPAPRADPTAAMVPDPFDNNKKYIVVVGGIGPDKFDENANGDTSEIISSKLVQVYDFGAQTWSTSLTQKMVPGWGAALVRVPEKFTDSNGDGEWNPGEPFTDSNGNGTFDEFLHLLNGVCTMDPVGCGYPNNNDYEIYTPARRAFPPTYPTALPDSWIQPTQPSPPPERDASAVLVNTLPITATSTRYIYKFCGGTGSVQATQDAKRLDVDDPTTNGWEDLKAVPGARTGDLAAVLTGTDASGTARQYPAVFGGSSDGTSVNNTDTIYLYEPDAGGWITDSTMNVGGTSYPRGNRFALGIIGGSVYVVGGTNATGVDGSMIRASLNPTNTPPPPPAENPIVGPWEDVQSDVPTPRTRVEFAQIGSKLYVFGGADGTNTSGQHWEDSFSDDVEVFDIGTQTWTTSDPLKGMQTETPIPVPLAKGVAAVLTDGSGNQKIYLVGGTSSGTGPLNTTTYIYDPVAKAWSTGAPMPTPRNYPGYFVYQNKLHVVGGVLATGVVTAAHEVYDPISNSWASDPTGTPFGGRQGGAMAVADHGLAGIWAYWLGGSTFDTQLSQCARLNLTPPAGTTASWEPIANIPLGGISGEAALTLVDGSNQYPTVFGGGFDPVPCAYDQVFHYFSAFYSDPAKQNTWEPDNPMDVLPTIGKVVRGSFAIGQWQGYVYVAAGDAGDCALVHRTLRAPIISTVVTDVTTVGDAKGLADGCNVNITSDEVVTLSAIYEAGVFYVQEPNGTSGIRVDLSSASGRTLPNVGDKVKVTGRMGTDTDGERAIQGAMFTDDGVGGTTPIRIVNNSDAGGKGYALLDGSRQAEGLSNQGLLMQVYGKVTYVDFINSVWYLDDGSNVYSGGTDDVGHPILGILVIDSGVWPSPGDYVSIAGVVSSEMVNGRQIRVLRGRDGTVASDFVDIVQAPITPGGSLSGNAVATALALDPGWNSFSLSAAPVFADPPSVFSSYCVPDASTCGANALWPGYSGYGDLYRWEIINPANSQPYASAVAWTPYDTGWGGMLLGDGYWLYNPGPTTVSLSYPGVDVSGDHWVSLPKAGWTLIGYPNLTPDHISVGGLQFTDGLVFKSYADAVASGWITGITEAGAGAPQAPTQTIPTSIVQSGRAYWVQTNRDNLAVVFPGPTAGNTGTIPGNGGGSVGPTTLAADPDAILADGHDSATLTLVLSDSSGAPLAGKQVSFVSSRGVTDSITQPSSATNSQGVATGAVTATTPGTAVITAKNVTDGVSIPVSTQVTFFPADGRPFIRKLKLNPVPVVVSGIGASYSLQADVYWSGSPGRIVFDLSGHPQSVGASGNSVTLSLDPATLSLPSQPGAVQTNTITATAFNAVGSASQPASLAFPVLNPPQWLVTPTVQAGPINIKTEPLLKQLTISADIKVPPSSIDATASAPALLPGLGGDWGVDVHPLELKPSITLRAGPSASQPLSGDFALIASAGADVKCGQSGGGDIGASITGSGTVTPRVALQRLSADFQGSLSFSTPKAPLPPPLSFIDWQVGIKPGLSGDIALVEGKPELVSGTGLKFDSGSLGLSVNVNGALSTGKEGLAYVEGGIGGTPYATAQFPAGVSSYCWSPYLHQIGVDVTASWKANFWRFTREGSYTWNLLQCPSGSAVDPFGGSAAGPTTELRDRSYLKAKGGYVVFPSGPSLQAVGGMPSPIANVGPDARPALAVNGNDGMLLFTYDDGSKPLGQSDEIYYARWTGSAWTDHAPLTSNLYPDNEPAVAYDSTGKAVAVWVTAPTVTGAETDASQIPPKMEIAYSSFDPTTAAWTAPTQLTSNTYTDCLPTLARAGDGRLSALWLASSDNSLPVWPDDQKDVHAQVWEADWNGSSLGAPYLMADGVAADSRVAVASGSGADVALWSQDTDKNSLTTADREIYAISRPTGGSWSTPLALTSDSYGDITPDAAVDSAGDPVAIWVKTAVPAVDAQGNQTVQDQLWYSTFTGGAWSTPAEALSAQAIQQPKLVRDTAGNLMAFWVAGSKEFYDIYYAVYDSAHSVWGQPQQLTHDPDAEWMIAPAAGSGSVLAAYIKRHVDLTGPVPAIGLSDLYLVSQALPEDLSIAPSDLSIDPTPPDRGGSATIHAVVHASGPVSLDNVVVAFYDGDPGTGGASIGRGTIPLIVSGGSGTASVTWNVPNDTAPHTVYAVVDPDDTVVEADKTNNTASLSVFGPDLVPYPPAITGYPSGNYVNIAAVVANPGDADAANAVVEFRLDSPTALRLYSQTLPLLAAGSEQTVSFAWDASTAAPGAHTLYVVADPANTIAETNEANNTAFGEIDLLPDIVVNPLDSTISQSGSTMTAQVTLSNPTPFSVGSFTVQATGGGVTLGQTSVPSLAPHGLATATVSWAATGKSYTQVKIEANPDHGVAEVSYLNNSVILAVANVQAIGQAKAVPDGTSVTLTGKVVTASFSGVIYIEEPDRSSGIRVTTSTPVNAGDVVNLSGAMDTTANGERQILATTVSVSSTGTTLAPLTIADQDLGGTGLGLQQGVKDAVGLNNIGLLVRLSGKVTYVDPAGQFFDVWDGSAVHDANAQNGVRVSASGLQLPAVGQFVSVTGISSCYTSGTDLYPLVRLRGQEDISVAVP